MKDKNDLVTDDMFSELETSERNKKSVEWLNKLEQDRKILRDFANESNNVLNNIVHDHKGKEVLRLNSNLIKKQGLTQEDVDKIKRLHLQRLVIEEQMEHARTEDLKMLFGFWTDNQYLTQAAWGFEKDSKYHRFWEVPHCSCPVLDNSDAHPYQQYINCDCPVHGD